MSISHASGVSRFRIHPAPCLRRTLVCSLVTLSWLLAVLETRVAAAQSAPVSQPSASRGSMVPTSLYASAGVGGSNVGLAARGLLNVAWGRMLFAVTGGLADEFNGFGGPSPSLEQKDLGVIAGLHLRDTFYLGGVGLGLGWVHSVNRGKRLGMQDGIGGQRELFESVERSDLGIPIIAHGAVFHGPVGIGALLSANINRTLPSVGACATLELGLM